MKIFLQEPVRDLSEDLVIEVNYGLNQNMTTGHLPAMLNIYDENVLTLKVGLRLMTLAQQTFKLTFFICRRCFYATVLLIDAFLILLLLVPCQVKHMAMKRRLFLITIFWK